MKYKEFAPDLYRQRNGMLSPVGSTKKSKPSTAMQNVEHLAKEQKEKKTWELMHT